MIIEKNDLLANDIRNFLIKHELAGDTRIYFGGICFDSISNTEYKILEDIKASDYFEYANDKGVSMSLEGELFHMINYGGRKSLMKKFDAIFEKHNCYYEQGFTWSLSVFEK